MASSSVSACQEESQWDQREPEARFNRRVPCMRPKDYTVRRRLRTSSSAGRKGHSLSAYRKRSIVAWTQPGCSNSTCVVRLGVGSTVLIGTASGAKKRNASK